MIIIIHIVLNILFSLLYLLIYVNRVTSRALRRRLIIPHTSYSGALRVPSLRRGALSETVSLYMLILLAQSRLIEPFRFVWTIKIN